jgi:hypothetical protein
MICGEDHAIGDCPQKKVNPNKKHTREEYEERRQEKKKARREERGAVEEGDEEDGEVAGNSTEVVEKKSGGVKDRFCPLCGAVTHFIEKCPDRKRDKKAGECMICGEAHAIRDCPERKVNPKAGNRSEKGGRGRGGRGRKRDRSPRRDRSPSPDRETKKAGRYAAYLDGGERARSPDNKRADWVKGGDDGEGAAGGDGE